MYKQWNAYITGMVDSMARSLYFNYVYSRNNLQIRYCRRAYIFTGELRMFIMTNVYLIVWFKYIAIHN